MNIYENVATQAIQSFFYNEPLWKKEILFNFLLEPFDLHYSDIREVITQDNLNNTIPDFTIITKKNKRLHYEVKINNANLTSMEKKENTRNAYLIRKDYYHINSIPQNAKKLFWEDLFKLIDNKEAGNDFDRFSLIREYMKESEYTILFTKNEIALFLAPSLIYKTYHYIQEFLTYIESCLKSPSISSDSYGIGYKYKNNNYWLGLVLGLDRKYFFSLCLSKTIVGKPDFENQDDIYFDGEWYFFPYGSSDFEAQAGSIYEKLKLGLDKDSDLKKWLSDSEKRIKEINLVYGFTNKIIDLVKHYNNGEIKDQKKESGVGGYIKDKKNYFIGFNTVIEKDKPLKVLFSIAIKKSCINTQKIDKSIINDGEWYYFPLYEETELFNAFIFSDTVDEQQENFNKLVNKTLKKTEKYLK